MAAEVYRQIPVIMFVNTSYLFLQVVVEKARTALLHPGLTGEAAMPTGGTGNHSRPVSHTGFDMGQVCHHSLQALMLPVQDLAIASAQQHVWCCSFSVFVLLACASLLTS